MTDQCPRCGSKSEQGTKYCQTCGYNLEPNYNADLVCPKCKTPYPANTNFCTNDGTKLLPESDSIRRCSICSTIYDDDTKFCPKDGGEVQVQSSIFFNSTQAFPKASLGNRFLAALLDGLITTGFSIPAIVFFVKGFYELEAYYNRAEATECFYFAFLFYLFPLIYSLVKDGLGEGQSWGKRALDLMVVSLDDHTPCTKGKSFYRNFISGLLVIVPVFGWIVEPILVLATEDGRKLGDKAANTQVINKNDFYEQTI